MSRPKEFSIPLFYFKKGYILGGLYTVVGILNRGSYGIVLLALDSDGTHVAIKALIGHSVPESKIELEILSNLPSSKHIVSYKTYFYENGYLFIVFEYYPYGDLYEAIVSNRLSKDTESIRSLMLQLIDGVSFLHKNGIYHRDLKPENILLSYDPVNDSVLLRIADFGLATMQKMVTDVGTGSNRYMAPEQYEVPSLYSSGTYSYDASKVDIWALGICLLNIIFSKNPFKMPSDADLVFSDYIRNPISFFDVFQNMSEDTFRCLQCSLLLNPEKRSLDEMRSAVEQVVDWTTDLQCIDENTTEKLDPLNHQNLSTIRTKESLCVPTLMIPSTYNNSLFWKKTIRSVGVVSDKNADTEETNQFMNISSSFPFYDSDGNNIENQKNDSHVSLDSGLGTSIGSYLNIDHPNSLDNSGVSKDLIDTLANITFPTSVKGSKNHLLFSKSWADDDGTSDDNFDTSFCHTPEELDQLNHISNSYIHNTTKRLDDKDSDHCLWTLAL